MLLSGLNVDSARSNGRLPCSRGGVLNNRFSSPLPTPPQALGFVDLPTLMGADVQPDETLLGMAQVGGSQ